MNPCEHPPELGRLTVENLPPIPLLDCGGVEPAQLVEERVHLRQPLLIPCLERARAAEVWQVEEVGISPVGPERK